MQTFIKTSETGTRERARPEYEWNILHETGGYSYAEADMVRRQLAKGPLRYGGKPLEEQFAGRARQHGYESGEAREILHEMAHCSGKLAPKCALLGELLNEITGEKR